jgi:hypothetical protein
MRRSFLYLFNSAGRQIVGSWEGVANMVRAYVISRPKFILGLMMSVLSCLFFPPSASLIGRSSDH